jgi:hypothetical protein
VRYKEGVRVGWMGTGLWEMIDPQCPLIVGLCVDRCLYQL